MKNIPPSTHTFLKNKKIGTLLLCLWAGSQVFGMVDVNSNGVSDVWEAMYGVLTEPNVDSDGDGFTNLEEAKAGTDPSDMNDAPKISVVESPESDALRSEIRTSAGVRYQLYLSTDLTTWYPVGPGLRGVGGMQEISIDLESSPTTGSVLVSKWTNVDSGVNVTGIRGYAGSDILAPSSESQISELTIPNSDPDEDDYGLWIRGWLVAEETGAHTFSVAGDDQVELWLSESAEPTNLVRIVNVEQYTSYQQWTRRTGQESAPVQLVAGNYYYFEAFHKEWTGGDHVSIAWTKPSDATGTRTVLSGSTLSTIGVSLNGLMDTEGKAFFRFDVIQDDSDGDGLTDYEEEVLGLDPQFATTQPRRDDYEEAVSRLSNTHVITLGVSRPRAYESTGEHAEWVLFRSGSIEPLTINLSYSGTATSGSDFAPLPTSIQFPAGATAVFLPMNPLSDAVLEGQETVTATIEAGEGYDVGAPSEATVLIDDAPDEVYQAYVRPPTGNSSGQGHVTLRKKGNDQQAWWNVTISGLSSPQTATTLYVSQDDGVSGIDFMELPRGKLVDQPWDVQAESGLTQADLLAALDAGEVWIRISTESNPSGELWGQLISGPASYTGYGLPDPASSLPNDSGELSRFLLQASFGPRMSDLETWGDQPFEEWIDVQLALSPSYHLPYVQARRAELLARDGSDGWQSTRQEAFWQHVITAEDQLRQRMAFALSQMFVISQNGSLAGDHEEVTSYYDLLLEHAFGNYRELLEDVTLSSMMGTYLSMMRNQKPNRETGHEPDENYAREVMQLFSIGLVQMNLDGTVNYDEEGLPLATYSQEHTVGLAHIFTGWGPHYDEVNPPTWSNGTVASRDDWFRYGRDRANPMTFYSDFHDREDRMIVGGVLVPGVLSGEQRMDMALDTLFYHPNVGPFMAKQLIQRFVTSNPSPAYVARVATTFNDNGSGTRGDLGAVLKAVLLDPEARNDDYREGYTRGKPLEPILRIARLLRAAELIPARISEDDPRFFLNFQYEIAEQAPLLAPSVFNFFQPGYVHPGAIDAAGVLSPEFQIFSETTAINQANFHYSKVRSGFYTNERDVEDNRLYTQIDWTRWIDLLNTEGLTPLEAQGLLLDKLDHLLLGGTMSSGLRQLILDSYESLPPWFEYQDNRQEDRVQVAWYLILTSPEAFVLR